VVGVGKGLSPFLSLSFFSLVLILQPLCIPGLSMQLPIFAGHEDQQSGLILEAGYSKKSDPD